MKRCLLVFAGYRYKATFVALDDLRAKADRSDLVAIYMHYHERILDG